MLTLHPRRPEITVGETTVRLPSTRWELLAHLADHPGRVVPVRRLGALMGYDDESGLWREHAYRMVCDIRQRLRQHNLPDPIETVPGRGYKLRGVG